MVEMRVGAGYAAFWVLAASPALSAETPATKPGPGPSVEELVITGERPNSQALIDRKVYSVTQDLQATNGTATDVLNNVPSVAVDADGNVSLRGDGNVTILVDGKPSAQFSGPAKGLSLQQFSASDIDRVEVLTTPPAQFKAEGTGGVINIVTKKTRRAGASGVAQVSLGDRRRYVASLSGAYNAGPVRLSGTLGLRQDVRDRRIISNREVRDPVYGALVDSHQDLDEQIRRKIPSLKVGLDYELNDRQSLSLSLSHREQSSIRTFDQNDRSGPPGAAATSRSTRRSDGHDWSIDAGESLRFDQKLDRPGETLSLALQHSVTREREDYAYLNSFALPPAPPTRDTLHLSLDLVKTEVSLDYDLPLGEDRGLKFGLDHEDDRNLFDPAGQRQDPVTGVWSIDPDLTHHFRYHQSIDAAYGEYRTPIGGWRLQAGLRFETARVTTLQYAGDLLGGRTDSGFYPSLHLERGLGDTGKLSLGVSRRLARPDPEALDPLIDRQDTHNLRAGNPNLRPQETWSWEARYGGAAHGLAYGLTAYYRSDRNRVTDIVRPISADVVLSTKTNLPRATAVGLEVTSSGKLMPQIGYSLSADLFRAEIDASALGITGLKSTTGANLKASLDWRPTPDDTAQISFTRSDRRLTPQGELDAVNIVNLGYKRQLGGNLAAIVTYSDALNGQKMRRQVTTPQLRDAYERDQIGRVGYVGLVYTFGGPAKTPAKGFDYEP